MKLRTPLFFLLPLFPLLTLSSLFSQETYDPREAFDPAFDAEPKSLTRSADGMPGPSYWQNRGDYSIDAVLDEQKKTISGTARITYVNNSPDSLAFIWLELGQNRFHSDSRSAKSLSQSSAFNGGFTIERVDVELHGRKSKGEYLIDDTRMQIRLPEAMGPNGDRLSVIIDYSFPIAPAGIGRSGMLETKNGVIYEIAQWYPHVAVYDDLRGWNVLPFLGAGEFYFDYGDYDYRITVPADHVVVGSGELVNPDEVLTGNEIDSLNRARSSDSTIVIRGRNDLGNRRADEATRTWHFRMNNTRDVAWASSRAFLWDAARMNLPGGKSALAMSVYPEESATDTAWNHSTQYLKGSVEIFSRTWFPYPYPVALSVAGPVGGMEYPGMFFGHWQAGGKVLWMLNNHEIGHVWFPMIVGSDERTNAWMDEGFNTFIDIYATDEYDNGRFAPKRDHEYAPGGGNPAREIVPYLQSDESQPILSYADGIPRQYSHPLEYYKTALGLVLLREEILGHNRFDYAFRIYIAHWAYRHPSPHDFFRAMNNAAGENLNWFWKGWFCENWKLDQSVRSVAYTDNDTSKGATITIENLGQLVMPATVSVTVSDGSQETIRLPVEIWERSGEFSFHYNSKRPVASVALDPDERLPDIDLSNNVWTPHSGE